MFGISRDSWCCGRAERPSKVNAASNKPVCGTFKPHPDHADGYVMFHDTQSPGYDKPLRCVGIHGLRCGSRGKLSFSIHSLSAWCGGALTLQVRSLLRHALSLYFLFHHCFRLCGLSPRVGLWRRRRLAAFRERTVEICPSLAVQLFVLSCMATSTTFPSICIFIYHIAKVSLHEIEQTSVSIQMWIIS